MNEWMNEQGMAEIRTMSVWIPFSLCVYSFVHVKFKKKRFNKSFVIGLGCFSYQIVVVVAVAQF